MLSIMKGKTVLITGAASGIGLRFAICFCRFDVS
jgi:NAD(P)-dependent dehydrogenase (short-subunit alcohol dehydrogenase family)